MDHSEKEELIRAASLLASQISAQDLEALVPMMSILESSESQDPIHVQRVHHGLRDVYGHDVADFLCQDAEGLHDISSRFASLYRTLAMMETTSGERSSSSETP